MHSSIAFSIEDLCRTIFDFWPERGILRDSIIKLPTFWGGLQSHTSIGRFLLLENVCTRTHTAANLTTAGADLFRYADTLTHTPGETSLAVI